MQRGEAVVGSDVDVAHAFIVEQRENEVGAVWSTRGVVQSSLALHVGPAVHGRLQIAWLEQHAELTLCQQLPHHAKLAVHARRAELRDQRLGKVLVECRATLWSLCQRPRVAAVEAAAVRLRGRDLGRGGH